MHTSAVPSTTPSRWLDIKSGIVILDVLLLCAMLAWLPFDPNVNKGLGILVFIAILWLTEAVNITITALSIPVLATLLGVFDMSKSLTDFANPVLFLFFGGFALAAALSKQGLDTQIAAKVMQLARGHLGWAAIVLFTITAALSMWISNTATAAMMMPLALGLLNDIDREQQLNTHTFVLLGVAYSASLGGMGALVGSPPNAIAAAYAHLGFFDWMRFGVPVMLILWPLALGILYLLLRPNLQHRLSVAVDADQSQWLWTRTRRLTLLIFGVTVLAWIFSQPLSRLLGNLDQFDSLVALVAIVAVGASGVASWPDIERQTEWGVLLLFGGGLCLSAVLQVSGTSAFLAQQMVSWFGGAPSWLVVLVIATFVVFLTELASNTATAALMIPLFAPIASSLGLSPVVMAVMVALAASCAFMLPVATPPNAMVFATGRVPQRQMMRVGLVLNLFCSLVLTLLVTLFS